MTKQELAKLFAMLTEHQETHRQYIKENDQYKEFDEGVIKGLDLAISTIGYVLKNKLD